MTILTGLIATVIAGVNAAVGDRVAGQCRDAGGLHRHAVWNVIGVAVYLAYGRVKSRLA
ncbi:MAG: hypothetical protein Q8N10_06605 [Phenylobacterium sp.]|nr:hypothetical protein [Phenylobacterium sp.]